MTADPASARTAYLRELASLTLRYDRELRGAGIDYVQIDTSQPLDFALLTYLAARARRKVSSDMSFLYPAFLVGALAIAIPIVLHLLRRDVAPEVPFTAVRLLRRSPVERSRRRRLRDLLLLAARIAALLLLAAAFARPYVAGAAGAIDRAHRRDRSLVQHGCARTIRTRTRPRATSGGRGIPW